MLSTNVNLKSIALFTIAVGGLFLSVHYSLGDVKSIIDLPSLMVFISSPLVLKLNIYLIPKLPTLFDKIINNNFKEITLMSGLSILCLGHFLLASGVGEPGGLENVWEGSSAAMLALIYSLIFIFLLLNTPETSMNVDPDQNCFGEIAIKKSPNFRFILSIVIAFLLYGFALFIAFEGGAAGSPSDLAGNNLRYVILTLVILALVAGKTGYFRYITSFKILFYDKTGSYDIQKVCSAIKTAKRYHLYICTLYILMLIPSIAKSDIVGFYSISANISLTMFKLGGIYFLLVVQDTLILQNSIIRNRFHHYKNESNIFRIYILIAIYFGFYSFYTLLNILRYLISPEII